MYWFACDSFSPSKNQIDENGYIPEGMYSECKDQT